MAMRSAESSKEQQSSKFIHLIRRNVVFTSVGFQILNSNTNVHYVVKHNNQQCINGVALSKSICTNSKKNKIMMFITQQNSLKIKTKIYV